MTQIDALTTAQQARLAEMAAGGRKVGSCTDPADRPRAEAGIGGLYRLAGFPAPRFLWAGSPMSAQILINLLLRKGTQLSPMLPGLPTDVRGAPLGAPVWEKLHSTIHPHPRFSMRESLKSALHPALERTLRSSLWAPMDSMPGRSLIPCLEAALQVRLRDSLRWELRDKRGSALLTSLLGMMGTFLQSFPPDPPRSGPAAAGGDNAHAKAARSLEELLFASTKNPVKIHSARKWGQHDINWILYFNFCREIGGRFAPEDDQWLGFHDEVARSAMWWWPFENLCVISERPELLLMDEAGRPHCPDGPAVAFRDGWRVWAWHGAQVRRKTIEAPVNPLRIDLEWNAEVRRVLIERCGWDAYIEATGAVVIHRDEMGELLEKTVGRNITVRLARVINGTPEPDGSHKRYIIPVPLESQSCREGIAATYGLQAGDYRDIVRT